MSTIIDHLVFSAESHEYIYLLRDVPVLLTKLFCLHKNPIMLFAMQNTLQKLWQKIWPLGGPHLVTATRTKHLVLVKSSRHVNVYNKYKITSVTVFKSIEACVCLWVQNNFFVVIATSCNSYFSLTVHISNFISHNCNFVSHNCNIISHNWDFVSHSCVFIYHNCDLMS